MAMLGYQIGEQAKPFCNAAAELLIKKNPGDHPVRMLDVGCSYGIGSAFVKFGLTFQEIVDFYASHPNLNYSSCTTETRRWLSKKHTVLDLVTIGLDNSKPAIRFALDAGLINVGITRDFEKLDMSTSEECEIFQKCNLLICIGSIGYVTALTLSKILKHFGQDSKQGVGPFIVITVLRMFDPIPILQVFEQFGYHVEQVENIRLPQRAFIDRKEKKKILQLLRKKKIDTRYWEDKGIMYADLLIAAPHDQFNELLQKIVSVPHNNRMS
ncbi:MAG: hypothetical protein HF978_20440 [Desulfobacteraceae bacterium]|nr:hypothetical protein [Desulfobacteraceae bacterium]MBC2757918.1 hypothetical protein [Desulfobacteraceae bacterium]